MADSNSTLSVFFKELRNRRVFRVAAVYLGIGYAILEASSIIIPTMGFPAVIVKIILGLMVIGLPMAIILAWMFQMTPEGLRRSPKSGEKQTQDAKPLTSNGIIIALLVVIAVLLAYPRYKEVPSPTVVTETIPALNEKSIAVLPFTPFADDREDQIFADGVHDDILTQLSKIGDLKVISRTSVMQYKGTTKLISDIAKELGVANILEGSVRRAGDEIRIVAQLINAETDEHIWAETFDRKYADIFSMQSEVAQKIARALKASLTPKEKQYIETKPTENQEAWELYIQAELLLDANFMDRDSIVALYEQATLLDPNFLLPYTKLVRLHAWAYFDGTGPDPSQERMEKASVALEKASAIDPNASETHMAQGYFYYYGSRDYEQALESFALARESQPNNSDLFMATAFVERRLGRWEQARENMDKAVFLDPNNASKVIEVYGISVSMRDYSSAGKYLERWSAITGGNDASIETNRYFLEFKRSADLEKMQGVLDQALEKFDARDLLSPRVMQTFYSRDYKTGLELMEEDSTVNDWAIRAEFLRLDGQDELARAYFDSARIETEARLKDNPKSWRFLTSLGFTFSRLGQCEEAIHWGKQAVAIVPLSIDAFDGSKAMGELAYIYAVCGEEEEALDLLEKCLSIPSNIGVSELKLDPGYNSMRDNPRFQKLIQKYDS